MKTKVINLGKGQVGKRGIYRGVEEVKESIQERRTRIDYVCI